MCLPLQRQHLLLFPTRLSLLLYLLPLAAPPMSPAGNSERVWGGPSPVAPTGISRPFG